MRKAMDFSIPVSTTLPPEAVDRVVAHRLNEIIGDYFIQDGKIRESHDYGRGTPYALPIAEVDDPRFALVVAAIRFQEALNATKTSAR